MPHIYISSDEINALSVIYYSTKINVITELQITANDSTLLVIVEMIRVNRFNLTDYSSNGFINI